MSSVCPECVGGDCQNGPPMWSEDENTSAMDTTNLPVARELNYGTASQISSRETWSSPVQNAVIYAYEDMDNSDNAINVVRADCEEREDY